MNDTPESHAARATADVNRWRLGIRLEVLPGQGVIEKFERAATYGFDAVELPGRYLDDYRVDLEANLDRLALPISSVSLGFRGSLVSADPNARRLCREDTKTLLRFCRRIGAVGLVMPPVLMQDTHARLTDPGAHGNLIDAQDALILEQLPELAQAAAAADVCLLLEPVNRFETEYLKRIDHAVRRCERVGGAGLGITADFFHMQLEELSTASSLRAAGDWLGHVHVAENTRCEPGPGSLGFRPGFRALRDIGYDGYVVVECRTLSGEQDQVLPRCASYLRREMGSL